MTKHHLIVISTRSVSALALSVLLCILCAGTTGTVLGYVSGYKAGSITCPSISTSQIGYPDGHVECAIAERPSPAAVIKYHNIRRSR